jgi:N4-gp56 family major capsid protein
MADTSFLVNDPLTVKAWAKKLFVDALKETKADKFMGSTSSSLIHVRDELSKSAGDRITVGLRMQLTQAGVLGDTTLEGNEEALTTYSDSVIIDQLRHATRSAGKMSEQRVTFSIRNENKMGLQDWWSDRIDTAFFNQVCGYTPQTDVRFTGNQAVIAPDTTRRIWAGTSITDDTTLGVGDVFTLKLIDVAVERASTLSPTIRPLNIGGEKKWVIFLHPYQVYDLRTNTNSGQWLDIQKAALQGGEGSKSPIYTGALGEYNGTIIHMDKRVTDGVTNAGVARSVVKRAAFCGAQAAVFAYGGDGGQEISWVEELFDYKNRLGVSAGMIWGLKKIMFNNVDFGAMTISTYGVAH